LLHPLHQPMSHVYEVANTTELSQTNKDDRKHTPFDCSLQIG